jgi:ADP-ribosylglycohydrolase
MSLPEIAEELRFETLEVHASPDGHRYRCITPMSRCALRDDERRALVSALASTDAGMDRGCGCLVGMAVGDAVGAPLEFLDAADEGRSATGSSYSLATHSYTNSFNKFGLEEGQWTDDTSMGLCLADSLLYQECTRLRHRAGAGGASGADSDAGAAGAAGTGGVAPPDAFDGSDARVRFWSWWFGGYNNAFRRVVVEAPAPTKKGLFGGFSLSKGSSGGGGGGGGAAKAAHPPTSVGLGGNISRSLYSMAAGEPPAPRYESGGQDAGNGSLMRLAAVPVCFGAAGDLPGACDAAEASSYTTHPGPIAAEACRFLAFLLVRALERGGEEDGAGAAAQFLEAVADEYMERVLPSRPPEVGDATALLRRLLLGREPDGGLERNWNWRTRGGGLDLCGTLARRGSQYNGYPNSAGYFGSYSLDGLAVALHAVHATDSFDTAIEKCVNFLGDADSTAAIAGQIAGAFYGWGEIGERFKRALQKWDGEEIALRGALLVQQGRRWAGEKKGAS